MLTAPQSEEGRRRRRRRAKQTDAFRPDIEGLRCIAVLFVLIWHAGVPWLPGGFVGVDVFFVISGFLMTTILHREMLATKHGKVDVWAFYGRRARRLIPASAVTLVTTALATFLILPETRWRDIGFDVAAAGGYVVNWVLADRAVDYLERGTAPSPILHFWSLSIEEQFYIFLPVLLVVLAWIVQKVGRSLTVTTFAVMAVIAAMSLAWSIYYTDVDPGRAYFVTTTRLWELALGGLVALSMPLMQKLPTVIAAAAAWIGVAGIAATGLLLTTTIPFPGAIALVPTVSTAIVIAAGPSAGPHGPVRIFNNKPVQWIGGCSYSLYLWHWPVLIIGGYYITDGLRDITMLEGVVLVTMSVLPAWLSLRYIENPVRNSTIMLDSVRNSMTLAFFGIVTSLIAGLSLAMAVPKAPPTGYVSQYVPPGGVEGKPVGAEVLVPDPLTSPAGIMVDFVKTITPSPQAAPDDNPPLYANGCHLPRDQVTPNWDACTYGDTESDVTVVLTGDSKAAQWMPALQAIASERGWKLVVSTKSACPFLSVAVRYEDQPYDQCVAWNREVQDYLAREKPAAVILSYGNYGWAALRRPELIAAAESSWGPVIDRGTSVAVIRDSPQSPVNLPECVAAHLDRLTACATPRNDALKDRDWSQPDLVAAVPGAQLVDMTDWICPAELCAPVIGGVLVYRDNEHLTATYSRSLAGPLGAALAGLPS